MHTKPSLRLLKSWGSEVGLLFLGGPVSTGPGCGLRLCKVSREPLWVPSQSFHHPGPAFARSHTTAAGGSEESSA